MLKRQDTISMALQRRRSTQLDQRAVPPRRLSSSWADQELAFYRAVKAGDLSKCRALLDKTRDAEERVAMANTISTRGDSMLIVAITLEYPNVVKLLLSNGADPTFKCNTPVPDSTPLSVAVVCNRPYIIKIVCEAYLTEQYLARGTFLSSRELDEHFKTDAERRVARRILVDIYATMSTEELVFGVPRDFQEHPGMMLCDLIELAATTELKALRIRSTEPFTADELSTASARLQLAAGGCLRAVGTVKDALGRFEVDEILKSPLGMHALRNALRYNCKTFIAQPEVQNFVHREWLGTLLYQATHFGTDSEEPLMHQLRCAGFAVIAWVTCLLFLPIVSALPFFETAAYEWISRGAHKKMEETKRQQTRVRRRHGSDDEKTIAKSLPGTAVRT